MKRKQIDLSNYKSKNVKVLSGRDKGNEAREKSKLGVIETEFDVIEILIPADLISLNSSFFLGMFGESVRHLKEEGFRKKYTFECSSKIMMSIEEGILQALKEGRPTF